MRQTLVVLLAVGAGACAPPTIEVKDRKLATTNPVGVDSMRLCSGAPFGTGVVDFGKDLREAGIDLSQGCIKSGTFELVAEVRDLTPGSGCTAISGTATVTGVFVEATCSTAALPTQTLRATCQSNTIQVADGTQVFEAINGCLDELERTQTEPLRKLINSCKPTKLKFVVEGTCSADLCFQANILIGVQTRNVVAQLGGVCP